MRIAVGMLMCLGGLSAAWANDPSPSNPAVAPSQQPATDQGKSAPAPDGAAATAPAAASTTLPTPNAASPPAAVTATTNKTENAPTPAAAPASAAAQSAKKTDLTADEKNYLSHGYKLQIRGGQKYFCRSEAQLGTRFATTTCRTAEQMAATRQNSKDFTSEMERPSGNTPGR
jgi:hypothetical protein